MRWRKIGGIAAGMLFLGVCQVLGFSTNNTTLTRVFDRNEAPIGDLITVTATFTNSETSSLRGFYYADQVPQGLTLSTTSVKINGSSVSNYTHEAGSLGDVYAGNIVHRWILETPTSFSQNNPVTSGSNVQIVYTLSSTQAGPYNVDEFSWAGYYPGGSKAAFGHSGNSDKKSISVVPTISGNAGVAGATLSYTDGTPKTATADGTGIYSFTVSYNWSGTVTPTKTGYTFSPVNRTYTNVLANQTSQNYTATAITYTISGNAGVAGATLSYTDATPKTATADGTGIYSFTVSYNWSGTVAPTKTGYTFSPVNRTYTNVLANQTSQDYTATAITYTISGSAGVASATLSYTDGTPKTATADGSGNYSFTVSYNWSGTVAPTKTGYSFSPVNRTYTNVLANQTSQDYTATAITYTISGSAGVASATLSYTDGTPKTATADGSGNYSFTVSYNWSGTVTPTKTGYTFSPVSRTYTNVLSNQTSQNYTATLQAFTISGYVRTSGSVGISGVLMSGLPGTPTTDATGYYSGWVDYNWSGTVTPTRAGVSFSPISTPYSNVTSNQSLNYTGTKTVTRLNIDKKIKDFKAGTATEQEVKDLINSYMEVPE